MTNTVAVGAVAPGENADHLRGATEMVPAEAEPASCFTACDMATAAAQGFRDGQLASLIVMPVYRSERGSDGELTYEAKAWNAALDEVARLNAVAEPVSSNTRGKRERWISNIRAAIKCSIPRHLRQNLENTAKEIENSMRYGGTKPLRDRIDELEHRLYSLDASPVEQSAMVVPEGLRDIGRVILTQDNRCTDRPIFCVMSKRPIVVDDDYDHDRIEWVNPGREYEQASEHKAQRLETLHEYGREVEGWVRLAIKDTDQFVTACFTEQGCRDFIARDGHNHRDPYIYAFGSYRNSEYQAVRDYLIGLPAAPTPEPASRDWPDGNYYGTCSVCRQQFTGHKRQLVCLLCSEQPAKEVQS